MIQFYRDVVADEPKARRWTYEEYYRIYEAGLFQDQRVELIAGEIIQRPPPTHSEVCSIGLAQEALQEAFGAGYWIRIQAPLFLKSDTEMEPDLAVVQGNPREFTEHPKSALLVVEVSQTSVTFDSRQKASVYAAAGITDYWIVDWVDHRLNVYRKPAPDSAAEFGFRYADVQSFKSGGSVAPSARPEARVGVADLFP